jgi:hypothetical protein
MTFRLEEWMRVVRRHRFPALTVWSGELRVGKARDWESAALAGTSETVRDRLACWLRDERAGRRREWPPF